MRVAERLVLLHSWVEVRLEGISAELVLLLLGLHGLVVAEWVHTSSSTKRISSCSSIHIGPKRIASSTVIPEWIAWLLGCEWVAHLGIVGAWHGRSIVHHVRLLHHGAAEGVRLESWLLLLLRHLLLLLLWRTWLEWVDDIATLVSVAVVHEIEVTTCWV